MLCLLKIKINFLIKTISKSRIHIKFITCILVTFVLFHELINHFHFIIKFLFHFSLFIYSSSFDFNEDENCE